MQAYSSDHWPSRWMLVCSSLVIARGSISAYTFDMDTQVEGHTETISEWIERFKAMTPEQKRAQLTAEYEQQRIDLATAYQNDMYHLARKYEKKLKALML